MGTGVARQAGLAGPGGTGGPSTLMATGPAGAVYRPRAVRHDEGTSECGR